MSWAEYHKKSEGLAASAELVAREGDLTRAGALYLEAAKAESEAFAALDPEKTRTIGITAVSAASLYYKGKELVSAEAFVLECLTRSPLPDFARAQLKELLQSIWGEIALSAAGLKLSKRDVLVSVKGEGIVTGGAPLDLILRKVEDIRAMFYRTVEFLMDKTFRTRGGPPIDIQRSFRPWLFQAAPGSYQFAVRLESSAQLEFPEIGGSPAPEVEMVTSKFLEIVAAAATDPENELPRIVPAPEYRAVFLKLTRSLAPTGKEQSNVEIRSAADPMIPSISLVATTRRNLTDSIKRARPPEAVSNAGVPVTLTGILRAVHLDEDWLEVTVLVEGQERHIRILNAGEAIDDVVGPMVNRPVTVEATASASGKHYFRDIQDAE